MSGKGEDIIEFTPTSRGADTAGVFSLFFDGSDVGLSNRENVDALAVDASGRLLLSTIGNFSVPVGKGDLRGANEDVFAFIPSSLGAVTAGAYDLSLYFDGGLFGLGRIDISGIDIVTAVVTQSPPSAPQALARAMSTGVVDRVLAEFEGSVPAPTLVPDLFPVQIGWRSRTTQLIIPA